MKKTDHHARFLPGYSSRLMGVTAALAAVALFAAACTGDDDNGDTTSTDPTPTSAASEGGATGAETPAATGATGAGTPAATGGNGGTGAAQPPSEITSPTASLESFRWEVTFSGSGAFLGEAGIPAAELEDIDGFTASGAYVAPDQAEVQVNIGGQSFGQVIKGDQQWLIIGGSVQGPLPATEEATSTIFVTEAADIEQSLSGTDLECEGPEEVNGVSAIRCEGDETANQELIDSFGAEGATVDEATFTVWIAVDGNYIVRWQLQAAGTTGGEPFEWDFEANITDVNSVDSIEDPS